MLELGKTYSGFTLKEIIPVAEINATIYDMTHEKSGARMIYLDRDDNNKVFYTAFKTLPEDSTGVFHIIEHSVLCGSKKYPVKEPFVDLLKGSMNTFLNAMTYPDKTVYPCASTNDKDFANLMSVYADAVFNPAIYTNENIFRQEGHHVELFDKDADPIFKGVVFNEMKGAFSSVDSRIYSGVSSALFPDTPYRYSSGGDPSCIPDLTYEQFIASHKKYYHPENCIIYLYGKMDILDRLAFLDNEYLSKYERLGNDIHIDEQKPVENLNVTGQYQISEGEDPDENAYITYAVVTGKYSDRARNLAYDILFDALASSNDSPLKKRFIESRMGQEFSAYLSEGILHPYVVFKLRKTNKDKKDEFMKTLTEALEGFVKDGIDKELLRASFNQTEFSLREGDTSSGPVGLNYGLYMLNSLLYGGRPETFLQYEDALNEVREGLDKDGYFESLISDLLNSKHRVLSVVTPSQTFTEELDKKEKARLAEYKASLTEDDVEKLIEMNNALVKFQESEDSPEASATIPTLEISDIDKKILPFVTEETTFGGIKTLLHKLNTNKISYLKFYFDLSKIEAEKLTYAAAFTSILSKVATENYSAEKLNTAIKLDLGDFSTYISYFASAKECDVCKPYFIFGISVLDSKIDRAIEILDEVINNTLLDKKEIEVLLKQKKNRMKLNFIGNGTSRAVSRVNSYESVEGTYSEIFGGYTHYTALSSLIENYDEKFDEFVSILTEMREKLFTKSGLIVSVTSGDEAFKALEDSLGKLKLSDKVYESEKAPTPVYNGNEGFNIPSQVNYVAKGLNIKKHGYEYNGKMNVLCQILRLDYMWNAVRVKGGAYGAGFSIRDHSGNMYASSYRDPKVVPTLANIDGIKDYLNSFASEHKDITKYIISTAADMTAPLSERDRGWVADDAYFRGYTEKDSERQLAEAISTTSEDIENYKFLAELIEKEGRICVVGAKEKIDEAKEIAVRYDI